MGNLSGCVEDGVVSCNTLKWKQRVRGSTRPSGTSWPIAIVRFTRLGSTFSDYVASYNLRVVVQGNGGNGPRAAELRGGESKLHFGRGCNLVLWY